MAERFYTVSEVAQCLNVNADKVRLFIVRGDLPAINVARRLGGRPRYRILESGLATFLARRAVVPIEAVRRIRRRDPLDVPRRY